MACVPMKTTQSEQARSFGEWVHHFYLVCRKLAHMLHYACQGLRLRSLWCSETLKASADVPKDKSKLQEHIQILMTAITLQDALY